MNKKTGILVAVAAFAVTVSGTYAFDAAALKEAGLTDDQIVAFERAKELREGGDLEAARDALLEANIDHDTLHKIRHALHHERHSEMEAVREAVENEDYQAFLEAAKDTPFADSIRTEADFELLIQAHTLMETGEREAAIELFTELGVGAPHKGGHAHSQRLQERLEEEMTDEQLAAFEAAKEANDKDTMHAILEEAGLTPPEGAPHRGGW